MKRGRMGIWKKVRVGNTGGRNREREKERNGNRDRRGIEESKKIEDDYAGKKQRPPGQAMTLKPEVLRAPSLSQCPVASCLISWETGRDGLKVAKALCFSLSCMIRARYLLRDKVTEVKSDEPQPSFVLRVDSIGKLVRICRQKIALARKKRKYDLVQFEMVDMAGEMHAVPPSITGTYMPTPYKSDIEETQVSYGSKSDNKTSETLSESNDFVSCDNSDKSSDSETYASCDSSLKTKTKDFPPAVDIKTLPESDVEDPNSTAGSPSFSCLENVKSPRIFCNKSGMNNRNVCKNNSVRVKKCFVCGSKLHLIKDCDFYNCVDSVPCKSKAAVNSAGRPNPAGSRNSPASVAAGGSDPAASRNRPAVNSAGRPNPAGWSKRPAPVSADRLVSAGWLNPAARPYFRPSSVYFNNMNWPELYDPMYMNAGRWGTAGDPSTDNDIGIVDSGCSRSMTGNKEKLDDFVQIKGGIVKFGGGDGRISGKGTIRTSKLDFENVYYVEELQHFNLFSVSQICDKKNKVLFTDTDCLVLSEEFQLPDASQVVLRIPREHDLYTFHISDLQPEQKVTCLVAKASLDESTRWHRRMAHVNFKTINKLAKEGLVDGLPLKVFTNEHNCVACNKGKQHKASYKHISAVRLITETLQLQLLHMDLFGLTKSEDETFYVLKEFIALIENQLNKKVKGIRCDNGTEFKNAKLIELCGEKGIKRDYSNPRTPQQNGVAERKNRTLIEAARTMLADSKLPTMFWTEARYVLIRVSITNPHNKTPYELISGKVPQIGHLKPFGCQVTILNTSDYLGKFEGKADEGYLHKVTVIMLCKKQTIVATSSTEAEYVAAASCCAKHIEIRHYFIRDANEKNLIQVLKIYTDDNVAVLLTKDWFLL
ncbi:putative ribonuclease H-like domain-containing protein, partial [Tanacetum coccineum]